MTGAAQTPRQCAACVILNGAGQVLLVRQNYGARFWGVPGGVVDPGETAPQAAVREAAEEAGIAVELTGVIGLYELRGGGWPDVLAHVFSARIVGGQQADAQPTILHPDEIAELRWCDPAALPQPLVPDIAAALEDLRAGRTGVVRVVERGVMPVPLPPEPRG
ncbi:NUDIX hydrolase [Deinococcus sp. RIT780]|uniref:NUDIX hydrolase n=1 Tax=Deinococcus sp. RIT780 TaxID=2870472 RepID=UPI001C8A8774|nr:NUDIX domain-containing protein [Deinococcus sp. RIT780]MBX8464597.1 NUDIX domain-containing protein [Deinococcus sp. RIT780]